MIAEYWDANQSAMIEPTDGADDVVRLVPDRYGVTAWESCRHEPLDVALAQELPDSGVGVLDDLWADSDADTPFAGRLVAGERSDEYAIAVDDSDGYSAEELAIHVVAR